MSNFTPPAMPPALPPLPPRPGAEVKSVFEMNNQGAVNSFPEAQAIPLQYDQIVPQPPYIDPNQHQNHQAAAPVTPPAYINPQQPGGLPYIGNPVQQQPAQSVYYYTPPQHGYVQPMNTPSWMLPQSFSRSNSTWKVVAAVAGAMVALMLVIIFMLFSSSYGVVGVLMSTVAAFFPFALIFGCIYWIGKWDAEPWGLRIIAFLWGAAGAVVATLAITMVSDLVIGPATSIFQATAIQAPLVEEFSKGIAILALGLFMKKYFDGPVDGVVYMTLIAAGFAFTENILYFSNSYAQYELQGLVQTFFLRGIMSPFAHVIFSLPMGILVGIARSRGVSIPATIGLWLAAYPLSVFLHGLWNGSATVVTDQGAWFIFYGIVQFPIFITAVAIAIWLRKTEAALTYKRLTEYGWQGWFTPPEVDAFATWEGRKRIIAWAKSKSPQSGELMKEITKDVVDLGYTRERIVRNRSQNPELLRTERELLEKITHNKNQLLSL